MKLDGFMMHGVKHVVILDSDGCPGIVIKCQRVYQWSSGALTLYVEGEPWKWIPPHRVYEIVGSEEG
jgi:hypothetical protein